MVWRGQMVDRIHPVWSLLGPFLCKIGSFLWKVRYHMPRQKGARYGEWWSHPGREREELKQHHRPLPSMHCVWSRFQTKLYRAHEDTAPQARFHLNWTMHCDQDFKSSNTFKSHMTKQHSSTIKAAPQSTVPPSIWCFYLVNASHCSALCVIKISNQIVLLRATWRNTTTEPRLHLRLLVNAIPYTQCNAIHNAIPNAILYTLEYYTSGTFYGSNQITVAHHSLHWTMHCVWSRC